MNEDRQMEVHYIDTGFPYTAAGSFMDFFEGLTHVPPNYGHPAPMPDQFQENGYWTMNMNPYKFGYSGTESTYYGYYEVNDIVPRMDVGRRDWEYPSVMNAEEPTTTETQSEEDGVMAMQTIPEECSPNHPSTSSPQAAWQDDVDPDNMTYEELLDLGEAVGSQNRGLSEALISLLPTSKCKFGSLFSRKKFGERCVICQMKYKIGEKQIKLPCKHFYHSECITKWLGINKLCPVCNNEVFGEERGTNT